MFISQAFAQEAASVASKGASGEIFTTLLYFAVILVVFYFLLIRPNKNV